MADFDNFEGANQVEEDPAAEFLAREQSELAGLEDDNYAGQQQDGFDAFEGQDAQPASQIDEDAVVDTGSYDDFGNDFLGGGLGDGFDSFAGGDASVTAGDSFMGDDNPMATGDGLLNMESPESSGGILDMGCSVSSPVVDMSQPVTNGPSDAYSAISQVDAQRAEPEKLRVWREEQKDRLEKKDTEEEAKKGDWHDVAKKELDDWYKHHADQLDKTRDNNRVAEQAFIKERDESVPGAQWEKICRLCEFNPKNMKSSKDVTRMRSMLLQLKQSPLVR